MGKDNDFSILRDNLKEIISSSKIKNRIEIISQEISNSYKNETPIIIGVLNGAFLFMADLVRNLKIQCEIDFVKIESYGNNIKSTGSIKLTKDISLDVSGRHVIIVEDIIDTGLSIKYLKNHIEKHHPKSIKYVTCLYKPHMQKLDFKIDWIGFKIDDGYFVGYGLDYKEIFRGLPAIYIMNL